MWPALQDMSIMQTATVRHNVAQLLTHPSYQLPKYHYHNHHETLLLSNWNKQTKLKKYFVQIRFNDFISRTFFFDYERRLSFTCYMHSIFVSTPTRLAANQLYSEPFQYDIDIYVVAVLDLITALYSHHCCDLGGSMVPHHPWDSRRPSEHHRGRAKLHHSQSREESCC